MSVSTTAELRHRMGFDEPTFALQPYIDSSPSQFDFLKPTSTVRVDGRKHSEFRKIFMRTGTHSQASGSSYVELNNTKVFCTVYGPRQTALHQFNEQANLNCTFKYTTFAEGIYTRRRFVADEEETDVCTQLQQALAVAVQLSRYPKSAIDVCILCVESDGNALGTAITAASLALADAGIHMFDLISACTVAQVGPHYFLDPTADEETHQTGSVTVACMPSLNQITQLLLHGGKLTEPAVCQGIEKCLDGCATLYGLMKQTLISAAVSEAELIARHEEELLQHVKEMNREKGKEEA